MYEVKDKESERILWKSFLKGDNQVLSLIYLQHSGAMYDYGCRFTSSKEMVKDCIQEVFCTLIRTRGHLSETDNIRLYLLKSLKRRILREIELSGRFPKQTMGNDYQFTLNLVDNVEDQMQEIDEQKRGLLVEAMQELTERQKEAIYLRFNRGLEYEEISYVLNLNYQSSRALIHRAIEKLRKVIQVPAKRMNHILLSLFYSSKEYVV